MCHTITMFCRKCSNRQKERYPCLEYMQQYPQYKVHVALPHDAPDCQEEPHISRAAATCGECLAKGR